MTTQDFFQQFENFAKNEIFHSFIINNHIDFAVCFKTHIECYLVQQFNIENEYLLKILVENIEIELFEEYHSITENLQNLQDKYHKIDNVFFKLIGVLQDNDFGSYSSKTIITDKLNNLF